MAADAVVNLKLAGVVVGRERERVGRSPGLESWFAGPHPERILSFSVLGLFGSPEARGVLGGSGNGLKLALTILMGLEVVVFLHDTDEHGLGRCYQGLPLLSGIAYGSRRNK